jgi:predicted N-formylglutamate amidohydrolase
MTIDLTAPRILRPQGSGRIVLFCDHASNYVPAELHDLGLPASELARHIAWDIGAAGVTAALSEIFDAPAILCNTSRLVIDCNRHLNAPDLIPELSDGTVIPGNLHVSEAARATLIERWFHGYHDAVESVLLEREVSAAAQTAAHPSGIPAGRDNERDHPVPMGSAFRSDVDVILPIWTSVLA